MDLAAALLVGGRVPFGDAKERRVQALRACLFRLWGREGISGLIRGGSHGISMCR